MNSEYENYLSALKKTEKELQELDLYKLDEDIKLLKKAFNIAYKNEVFTLYKYDKETRDMLKFELFSRLTQYSGSLTFLAIQILAANSIMIRGGFERKEKFFKKKCGIAINHLRSNKSHVSAIRCNGGFKLSGTLTWASGHKIFDHLLIGFHFQSQEYEVIAKFEKNKNFKIISQPDTFVGFSLSTVNIELDNFFVKDENIVSSNTMGNYSRKKSLSKTVHYALYGVGVGAIEEIQDEEFKKNAQKKLRKLKKRFLESEDGNKLDDLRISLFNLVQKIVTIGMILNGGKSILTEQSFQRYYRELIMFNANGLNQNIKELFLDDFIIGNN